MIRMIASALTAATLSSLPHAAHARDARFVDTSQIDRLVESFTGRTLGSTGGAREPVDPRLRLRACNQALALDWYGQPGRVVEVQCIGADGWRIYVNLLREAAPQEATKVIARGETVTIAVRGRGFSIQQKGEAQEAGAVGEWIKVRADRKASAVQALIVRPGLVEIRAD
ncbi:flagella basal body P-ring formation protein FlgA [Erythrobacter sp. MTPC3]|uniref:flagella basal body P-ring formation protein FlgA n=1 Tax=Erythrobacter sp. MTPC3 TaxID=3056564 RepID=UPI0036F28B2C